MFALAVMGYADFDIICAILFPVVRVNYGLKCCAHFIGFLQVIWLDSSICGSHPFWLSRILNHI